MSSAGKEGGRVAALYIRVSTLDQAREGYSLAAQQAALEAWAAQKSYATQLYADEGISGKDIGHRPAMRQMLADVEAGKIAVVAVWALSRLTRSVADLYATLELLAARGVALISHTEGFDTGTPTGRAMMGLLGVFAQMEREITAERVRAAMAERAAQGKRTCSCVLGYDLDGSDSLVPNPQEAEIKNRRSASERSCPGWIKPISINIASTSSVVTFLPASSFDGAGFSFFGESANRSSRVYPKECTTARTVSSFGSFVCPANSLLRVPTGTSDSSEICFVVFPLLFFMAAKSQALAANFFIPDSNFLVAKWGGRML